MTTVKFNKGIVYIDNKIVGNVKEHVFRQGEMSKMNTYTGDHPPLPVPEPGWIKYPNLLSLVWKGNQMRISSLRTIFL